MVEVLLLSDSSFARCLLSDHRILSQAEPAAEGKKLLAADPEALIAAAKAGDIDKVTELEEGSDAYGIEYGRP